MGQPRSGDSRRPVLEKSRCSWDNRSRGSTVPAICVCCEENVMVSANRAPVASLILGVLAACPAAAGAADALTDVSYRPPVPGTLSVSLRTRDKDTGEESIEEVQWNAAETAIIICDMWDGHYCQA